MFKIAQILAVLLLMGGYAQAQQSYTQGVDYIVMHDGAADQSGVTEFMAYTCNHCYYSQPVFEQLKQSLPAGVGYSKVPAHHVLLPRPEAEVFDAAFHVAETLQNSDSIHDAIFEKIWFKHQRHTISTDQKMAVFFIEFGVATNDYIKRAKSFPVQAAIAKGKQLVSRLGSNLSGLPTLVVNNKYKVNLPTADLNGLVAHLLSLN